MHFATTIICATTLINTISSEDITYLDLSELESDRITSREYPTERRNNKYVDIYTNYRDIPTVLENYQTVSTRPFITENSKRFERRLISSNEYDYSANKLKKHDQKSQSSPADDRNTYDYGRPKFKTSNYTNRYVYTSHVQKIPKLVQKTEPKPTQPTRTSINNILKRYIADLYAQKQQRPKKSALRNVKFLEEPLQALKNKTMKFANKFFSLFTVIEFPNSRCQANSASSDYEGTCYTRVECDKLNGTAIGECANGYGVCCICKLCF